MAKEKKLKQQKKEKNRPMKGMSFKERVQYIKEKIVFFFKEAVFYGRFLILLFFVVLEYLLNRKPHRKVNKPNRKRIVKFDWLQRWYDSKIYPKVLKVFDQKAPNEVKDSDLIFLAMKNLSTKKSRTFVTIGGMAIGFGAVILLLSAGYGFERLVISQVASLNEMRQIEVTTSQGSALSFDEEVIAQIKSLERVDHIVPTITSVSKVTYNNAVSDVIAYGVTTQYFEESALSAIRGEIFESYECVFGHDQSDETESLVVEEAKGEVAGASSTIISNNSMGKELYQIRYSIYPLVWKPVYKYPNSQSELIGYTKREMGNQEAVEVWGMKYNTEDSNQQAVDLDGNEYGVWIENSFPIWQKQSCKMDNPDCVDSKYVVDKEGGVQEVLYGYISEKDVSVERYKITDGSALEVYTGKVVDSTNFSLKVDEYTNIYMDPNQTEPEVTTINELTENIYEGEIIYGGYYATEDNNFVVSNTGSRYSYWISTELSLWISEECDSLCESYSTKETSDNTKNVLMKVYLRASDIILLDVENEGIFGSVLGEQDVNGANLIDLESLIDEEDDGIDWVSIAEELGTAESVDKDIKPLPEDAQMVALANTAMLNLLGLETSDAVDEEFETYFIYDSKLFGKTNYLAESEPGTFKIVGVVSDGKTPAFYVPVTDIAVDGISSVSNVKVVLEDERFVDEVRAEIEALGFQTSSVTDTVGSINNLFKNLRIALLVLGLIALGVASLGMFNTLTVSLIEKTREVGLLKTMGLKAKEVKVLFLAESILMSVMGGGAGLLLGFLVGKLLSVLISALALAQGQGVLDVTYIPAALGAGLVFISFVVGVATGWYPAERAKNVSALNALRYE